MFDSGSRDAISRIRRRIRYRARRVAPSEDFTMTSAAIAGRSAVHLKVLSAGAVKYVLTDFAPRFTRDTGDQVEFTFGTIGGVRKRLGDGETADIIMGTAPAISQLEQSGVIAAGSRADLGRTLTAIPKRADTTMQD